MRYWNTDGPTSPVNPDDEDEDNEIPDEYFEDK